MYSQFCSIKEHHQNSLYIVCIEEVARIKDTLQIMINLITQFTFKKVLNKVSTAIIREKLGYIGCDMLKQYCQIFLQLRKYFSTTKDSIKSLEKATEKQMKE